MTAPHVSCVVVAFHDPASLQALLAGLDHPELEVVVNVEDDDRVAGVAAEAGASVVAVRGNPGYGTAVNLGVAAAAGLVIVFLNDDVTIGAASVLALAEVVQSGGADVAVPAVRTPSGDLEPTIAPLVTPRSLALEWLLVPDHRPSSGLAARLLDRAPVEKWRAPVGPEPVPAASAVVVAATAGLLRAIPLPEAYFLYWEESEWFWHLRAAGRRVVFRPELAAVHAGGRDDVRPDKARLLARNAVRCVRRTQGRAAAARALPVVVAWNLRLVATACVRAMAPSRRRPGLVRARLAGLSAALGATPFVWSADDGARAAAIRADTEPLRS